MFSKVINFVPIDLKIGTHIDRTNTMYLSKKCIDQNNVTNVSMATKYPIIKHMAFFKTLTFFISKNNEDIGQKFLPDNYDHTLMLYKINDLEWSKFKVTLRMYWFSTAAMSHKLSRINFHYLFRDTSRDILADQN